MAPLPFTIVGDESHGVLVAQRLLKIPPRYAGVTLEGLRADFSRHPKQSDAINLIKSCPEDSYVICGKWGTGKTHLFWALYQHVVNDVNRRVVACTMLQLINRSMRVIHAAMRQRAKSIVSLTSAIGLPCL